MKYNWKLVILINANKTTLCLKFISGISDAKYEGMQSYMHIYENLIHNSNSFIFGGFFKYKIYALHFIKLGILTNRKFMVTH